MRQDREMDTNAAADALYDALHTRIFREEFREIYARMTTVDLDATRAEAQRSWPDGPEGWQAETHRRAVRAAFVRGAGWQARRGQEWPERESDTPE